MRKDIWKKILIVGFLVRDMDMKKIAALASKPKNRGEMKNPDAVYEGMASCGDTMKFYLKIGKRIAGGKEEEYISDIKYETLGCAVAVATATVTSELAKGKSLEEAKKISEGQVIESLGGVPDVKLHCVDLTVSALKGAIKNWEEKKK